MAALTPALGALGNIVGTVTAIDSTINTLGAIGSPQRQREQDLALQQLRERQALDQRVQRQQATLNKQRIDTEAQAAEDNRLRALRRAVASRNAAFGAQGISTNNGSAEAVLLGLYNESDEEAQRRNQLDTIRKSAINQDLRSQRSANLLQVSQLKQRQDLENQF